MSNYLNSIKASVFPEWVFAGQPTRKPRRAGLSMQRIVAWYRRSQQRRRLRELDAHLLRDIGLTAEEAHFEASKPFWMD